MHFKLNTKLGQWIADNAQNAGGKLVRANVGLGDHISGRVHYINADWAGYGGRWFVCMMHCGPTSLICAKNIDEAYMEYIDDHCHDESDDAHPDDNGTWTDSGKFISEAQESYVFVRHAEAFPELHLEAVLDEENPRY